MSDIYYLAKSNSSKSLYSCDPRKLLILSELDLDWDKGQDFRELAESDTMSTYDLNERMQELIKQKFLEFEMSIYGSTRSINRNQQNYSFDLDLDEFEPLSDDKQKLIKKKYSKPKRISARLGEYFNSSRRNYNGRFVKNKICQFRTTKLFHCSICSYYIRR